MNVGIPECRAAAKRICIGSFPEEGPSRNSLAGILPLLPGFRDMTGLPADVPDAGGRKRRRRSLIMGRDGFIALIRRNGKESKGMSREVRWAHEGGIPILGMGLEGDGPREEPRQAHGIPVAPWSPGVLKGFIWAC